MNSVVPTRGESVSALEERGFFLKYLKLTLTPKYKANALFFSLFGGPSPAVIASMASAAGVDALLSRGCFLPTLEQTLQRTAQ